MTTSAFAVDEFMSKLDGKGSYAKSNRFTVEIIAPTTLVSSVQASSIEFLIKTVSFPARTFGTTTYRSGGKFGLDVPYEMTEEPVAISFLGTNDWSARSFWNDWISHIQSTSSYNMNYYREYIGTVKISVYNETEQDTTSPTHQVTLHEAWPKTISAIELGWESTELVDFEVDVAYSWWTATGSNGTPSTELRHGEEHGGRGRSRTTNRTPNRPAFRGRGGR
tara:strand:+ start:124 stop:789 length:666 start_codon:yes stop_codon:yes gene_type:complete